MKPQKIKLLFEQLAAQPGVLGSVIFESDGIIVASNMASEQNPENICIIYKSAADTVSKMGHNRLHQMVCRTDLGFLVIYNFGDGFLATTSNALESKSLMRLMSSQITLLADKQQTWLQKLMRWLFRDSNPA